MANPDYSKLSKLVERIRKFNTDRDWSQFHNPKDLAISLVLEANEVLEHFQWKNSEEMQKHLLTKKGEVGDELADVLYWVLLMSDYFDIDPVSALERKQAENETKYPTEKAKGSHAKYNELT